MLTFVEVEYELNVGTLKTACACFVYIVDYIQCDESPASEVGVSKKSLRLYVKI